MMPAPSDIFLSAINSNIDSLVTEDTRVYKVVLKQQFPKIHDLAFVENVIARSLTRDSVPEISTDPLILKVESIDDQPVTNPDLIFLQNLFPVEVPEDQYQAFVTIKILAKKNIDFQDSLVNALKGDSGDVTRLTQEFVTHVVKDESCPIPIIKVEDITVL